jgi:hypothetical protein
LAAEYEISEDDLLSAAVRVRQLAESKAEDFFTRRGYESAADFLKHYRRLSGVVLRHTDGHVLWLNTVARHPVPPQIVTAIRARARSMAEVVPTGGAA